MTMISQNGNFSQNMNEEPHQTSVSILTQKRNQLDSNSDQM